MSRLFKQAMGLFLILFAVFTFVVGRVVYHNFMENNQEWQFSQLQTQVATLKSQLDQADFLTIEDLIQGIEPTAAAIDQGVQVYTPDGQLVYNSLDQAMQLPQLSISQVMESDPNTFHPQLVEQEGQADLFFIATAIEAGNGQPLAILSLTDWENEGFTVRRAIQLYTLLFTMGALCFMFLFFIYWTRSVVQPLEEIKAVADQISEKNYSHRYRSKHFNEIDQLGFSINKLASKLELQVYELETRNEQLYHLIENLNIGIILLDEHRRIKIVNSTMSQLLEINAVDYINHPYIHIIKSPWIIEMIENAFESKQTQSQEIILENSEEYILDTNIIPIHLSHETDFGLIVLFYDISEIRRLEKVRTDFVANASHELRTPVTALKGFTETLLDGAMEDKETLVYFLKIMQDESERLDSIVGDILQLSRLEQKADPFSEEVINVKAIVESVYDVLKQKASHKSISLQLQVHHDVSITYNKDSLKQILMNLVNNAILYNYEGGYVQTAIEDMGDEVRIAVTDNGIGIQDHEQKRIFERFYRVDKARSRNAGGTGLGLSIVRHMVENTGGRLMVDSTFGQGSTFTIFLKKEKN